MAVEESGIKFIVPGIEQAQRLLERMDKTLARLEKQVKRTTASTQKANKQTEKSFESVARAADKAGSKQGGVGRFTSTLGKMGKEISGNIPGMSQFAGLLGGGGGAGIGGMSIAAGAGAAALGIGAVIALLPKLAGAMQQMGQLAMTTQAFANVVGDTAVFERIRQQTGGMIDDFQLMQLSILALQGTTRQFRDVVGQNLGKIFDVTQRAAAAIGQSADVIREKFLLGLRRRSNMLLDDIGITVDATKANEAYAESIGKAASQLTEQEKQAAFAAEAISQLDRIAEELPERNPILAFLGRLKTAFTNIKNFFLEAFRPLFEPLGKLTGVIGGVESGVKNIMAVVREISSVMGAFINTVFKAVEVVTTVASPAFRFFGAILKNILAIIILVYRGFKWVWDQITALLQSIIDKIAPSFQRAGDDAEKMVDGFFTSMVRKLAHGGAFMMGALAAGILKGATFVLQAVNFVAGIIADFLVGLSPPKKGPLSDIDKGGQNVANAWLDGFMGSFATPMQQMAQQVNEALGSIGRMSRTQVEAALARLDRQIQPFVENLEIAKARLEQVAGFVDPAVRVMERMRKRAMRALAEGRGDVDALRGLDAQIMRLQEMKDLEQERVDMAQLQLSFGKSQQALQRALLNIQLRRLGPAEKEAAMAKAKAGGAADIPGEAGEGGLPGMGDPIDLLGGSVTAQADALMAAAGEGWAAGLEGSGFAGAMEGFEEQTGAFSDNMGRIQDSFGGFGDRIMEALGSLPDRIGGIAGRIGDSLINAFSYPIDIVVSLFDGLRTRVSGALDGLTGYVRGNFKDDLKSSWELSFGEDGVIASAFKEGSAFWNYIVSTESVTGFRGMMSSMAAWMYELFAPAMDNAFKSVFGEGGIISQYFTDESTLGKIFGTYEPGSFREKLADAYNWTATTFRNLMDSAFNIIFGDGGAVAGYFGDGSAFAGLFGEAGGFITPIQAGFNSMLEFTQGAVKWIFDKIYDVFNEFEWVPGLGDYISELNIPGDWLTAGFPGLAKGGRFGRGIYEVGERGPELAFMDQPGFMMNTSRVMGLFDRIMSPKPMPMPVPPQTITNNNNRSTTFNQNYNFPDMGSAIVGQRQQYARGR